MDESKGKPSKPRPRERLAYVPRLLWNAEESAAMLGLSVFQMLRLREKHAFYRPDCFVPSRCMPQEAGEGKKPRLHPLWHIRHLELIAFAWTVDENGQRQYEDKEAYDRWKDIQNETDHGYAKAAGYV